MSPACPQLSPEQKGTPLTLFRIRYLVLATCTLYMYSSIELFLSVHCNLLIDFHLNLKFTRRKLNVRDTCLKFICFILLETKLINMSAS